MLRTLPEAVVTRIGVSRVGYATCPVTKLSIFAFRNKKTVERNALITDFETKMKVQYTDNKLKAREHKSHISL